VELVGTFNNLLSRLRETAEAKGRFYAAASHELRTPLQALSGHLEVALSRPRSADEYHGTLEEALRQTKRLISLVRDLLFLNQMETAANALLCEQVSITEICERELRQLQPLIAQRGLQVTTALEADGEILVPPTHAAMLIRNTLENAVKYATPAGQVRVAIQEVPEGVRVEVFNTFPLSPDWNAELLFEAFYRPDVSRNAKTGGNGLGLAICKAITLTNGWTISLAHTGEGVQASLLLKGQRP
jgi:two-component system heavy metal sensor histidine kinase CusS